MTDQYISALICPVKKEHKASIKRQELDLNEKRLICFIFDVLNVKEKKAMPRHPFQVLACETKKHMQTQKKHKKSRFNTQILLDQNKQRKSISFICSRFQTKALKLRGWGSKLNQIHIKNSKEAKKYSFSVLKFFQI